MTYSYEEAVYKHYSQFYGGSMYIPSKMNIVYGFPFGDDYKDEYFVTENILVEKIKSRTAHPSLIGRYMSYIEETDGDIEPAWLTAGRKLKDGKVVPKWNNVFHALDGNHRIEATKKLGRKTVKAILPKSHFEFYKANINTFGIEV